MSKLHTNPSQADEFGLFDGILSAFHAIGAFFSSALKNFQMARMIQALSEMTDGQLAEIGITRSGIPAYAFELLNGAPASETGYEA